MKYLLLSVLLCGAAHADCVNGLKAKTTYQIIDSHTILFTGGFGSGVIIKSFSFFYSTSRVQVLKDSFCSYESAVLYVDGEVVDAQEVKSF